MAEKPTYEELVKRVQELERAENEERLKLALDSVNDAVWDWRVDTGEIHFSSSWYTIIGYEPGELPQELETWRNLLYPDDLPHVKQTVYLHLESGEPFEMEFRMRAKDGRWKWILGRGKTVEKDGKGNALRMIGTHVDITDRKKAEEALRESEQKFRMLAENPVIGVFIHQDEKFVYVNGRLAEMHGYRPEEVVGQPFYFLVPPEARETLIKKKRLRQEAEDKSIRRLEIPRMRKDGSIFWGEAIVSGLNYKGRHAVIGQVIDVSERKKAEESLRESQERYKRIFQENLSIIFIRDPETERLIDVNPAACSFYGYSRDEMIGMELVKIIQGHQERIKKRTEETLAKGKNYFTARHYLKNGESRDVEVYNNTMMMGGKKAIICIIHDITERKRAEESLRGSEERYRRLFEMESDAIFIIENETGNILEVNNAASKMYGYTREEFLKRKNTDISAEPDETRKATESRKTTVPIRYHKKKDGTVFTVEITATHLKWQGRDVHIAAIRDITFRMKAEEEKLELERRLQQAQKMEAIGTLAGGIAHDFNNLLSPIMLHSEMSMLELPPDSPVQQNLGYIYRAGERARDLVKQILIFARRREEDRIPLKTSLVVKEVIKFLRSTIPSIINIQYELKTENDTVLADPTQMNQIVMNLCTNAAHAMREKGGVLKVTLTDVHIGSDKTNQFVGLSPGPYLRLSVSDTGTGVPPEIFDKIFEPYFTTKGPGEGTGMGLAIVHGIVKNYGGDIALESELGKGTVFHVLLPIVEVEPSPIAEQNAELPKGNERILLVDDEKAAVDSLQPMLERLGYKVTSRTSSIEGLEAFRHKPEAFDLVITDQTMPNMTGKELARKLLSIRAGIPIILCTGFSEQIDEKKAMLMGIRAFVMKPIVMRQIAKKIREVLDKK